MEDWKIASIVLGSWALYAVLAILLVKKLTGRGMDYLRKTPVNFMYTCQASARYDFSNLKMKEIYFCACFLFPIRMAFLLGFVVLQSMLILILRLIFCGKRLLYQLH
jgi:hypothetical protein